MKSILVVLICLLVLSLFSQSSDADTIISTEPQELSFILNNLEHVGTYVDNMPWGVNIYSVAQSGDCYGFNIYCPKEWLYIGITEIQLGPQQRLYKLEGSYGWQVKSVKFRSDIDKPDGCIDIGLVEKEADKEHKKWIYIPREICINIEKATVVR
jgi:hypothetical protein